MIRGTSFREAPVRAPEENKRIPIAACEMLHLAKHDDVIANFNRVERRALEMCETTAYQRQIASAPFPVDTLKTLRDGSTSELCRNKFLSHGKDVYGKTSRCSKLRINIGFTV